jgi:hypothetical protein
VKRISFGLTEEQFTAGIKDVTRRLGWHHLYPGVRLQAVNKAMGFRKGEHARLLGVIEVVDVRSERLDVITDHDVKREGFPGKSAEWFVEMFCAAMGCTGATIITRIEFKRIPT